eukprot:CAMPEP_0205884498 /NCGR_PEP_ID=MMETSP1083-20121108/18146_1 /ASSEMBLY_ACC=CAM_ASM_000430 /TAXON_ID=97485 /ORGANISM="Prymnesium parvum, Strain Texoma1" /LENGTH=49 /DNA_ID= /DNA_START= /DNA_END= /DNA_ORIENTATION=
MPLQDDEQPVEDRVLLQDDGTVLEDALVHALGDCRQLLQAERLERLHPP